MDKEISLNRSGVVQNGQKVLKYMVGSSLAAQGMGLRYSGYIKSQMGISGMYEFQLNTWPDKAQNAPYVGSSCRYRAWPGLWT